MKTMKLFAVLMTALLLAVSAQAGTISGTIKYDGKVPQFKPIEMQADPICLSQHTSAIFPETLVLGPDNTMANVFVYVKGGLPAGQTYPIPAEAVVLDQKGCKYTPHVIGVMVKQPVKILNPDGTLHNVHVLSAKNAEQNFAMPKFRAEMTHTFDTAEFMFPVKCDVHPWMGAWVAVMPHPFYSVSKEDGKFSIANLPAGTYEIEAWHEKLGTQKATVTIGADETKEANFTFSRPTDAAK